LGLAIVREAARLHGGEASVRSVEGKGTTFTVVVPLVAFEAEEAKLTQPGLEAAPVPAAPVSVPPAARAVDAGGAADRAGPAPDAPLVLVVEDDDDLRSFIADILSERYRVRTARNGAEGLAAALELRPDAIVSDVSMPEMDGYELTRQLRKHAETQSTPVMLVTARRELGRVLEGFEAGADDYVAKPFHGRELLSRVGVHVRLRKLMQELAHKERLSMAGVMAASVAHHVRNPLTSIQAGLPAITRRLGNHIDPSTREMMSVMLDCAQRIERLTGDLLDLSRVDRAEQGVFPVADAVRRATRVIEPAVPENVRLRVELDDALEVSGNEAELHQVVLNLVDNAIRACGTKGQIDVVLRRDGSDALLEVADSGPGIDPARREWIFEPFTTTRGPSEGTGLGLSIAKQVVTQHRGTIAAARSPSLGGALFTIRIPVFEPARGNTNAPARSGVSAAS
jgi:signal transduction histidine kinase